MRTSSQTPRACASSLQCAPATPRELRCAASDPVILVASSSEFADEQGVGCEHSEPPTDPDAPCGSSSHEDFRAGCYSHSTHGYGDAVTILALAKTATRHGARLRPRDLRAAAQHPVMRSLAKHLTCAGTP